MERGYCGIQPASRKVVLGVRDAITCPYKWAPFSEAGDGITVQWHF
jgi:hypothetical protein